MLKYIFLILSIPLILVFIWFKDGYLIGHAEGALPFYKLERYLEPTSYAWMEHPGLGNISLLTTAGKPTYLILTFLQNNLGIPGFIIQAGLLYFLFASAGLGIYLLTKEFFPKLDSRYALLSVFFYWFSPLSITLWNRYLLNYIFFLGALPILLFVFTKGVNSRKYFYAPLLTILIGVYSYLLSALVFVLLLWLIFILFTFFFFITSKNKADCWFYTKFLSLLLVLFVVTNSWWITQVFSLKFQMPISQTISNFSIGENLETLRLLSIKLGDLTNVVRLINASTAEVIELDWFNFYNSPIAVFFEFLIVAAILFTIIKKRVEKSLLILGGIFFIAIFLVKGTNIPLGEIYKILFQTFSPLQVFRNPFEKFSFILNLITALLFGYSIFIFSNYLIGKTKKNYIPIILFLFFLIPIIMLGYPFFYNLVFTSNEPPTNNPIVGYKVKVPDYYEQASGFLQSKGNNFRFIGFPLGDEGITYNWEKGYTGVELSSTLFSTPGILFNTSVPYYSDIVPQLERLLLKNDNFFFVANSLNVRFLLLRTDIDWKERNMKDPQVILNKISDLENQGLVKKIGQYGALTLWENLSWKDYTFYGANKIISTLPEAINLYNVTPDIASGEITIAGISDEISENGLISKVIVNPVQSINTQNLDYESYTLSITKEGDYQIHFDNLANFDSKVIIEKKLITINNIPLTTLDPIHFTKGEYQIIVNNLHGDNAIDLLKMSDSSDSRGYFKNFELNNFNPNISNYLVSLDFQSNTNQNMTIYIFQDNDKVRNGEKNTPLNLDLGPYRRNNSIQLNSFFFIRPSATAAWVSLLSDQPIELSAIKSLSVTPLIKPKPFFVSTESSLRQITIPNVGYKKINPTKYAVHVENATSPFLLVFSELFNNKWEAFYNDKEGIKSHFRINSYANGWLVNKTGNFDINIEFTPQRLYRQGEIIALLSHLMNGVILVALVVRQIKNKA